MALFRVLVGLPLTMSGALALVARAFNMPQLDVFPVFRNGHLDFLQFWPFAYLFLGIGIALLVWAWRRPSLDDEPPGRPMRLDRRGRLRPY